jgi:dolichol-phosphate mannosyltransferase
VSVVVPIYNEEAAIGGVIRDLLGVLRSLDGQHEIVAVNDGSTDCTARVLEVLRADNPELRVVTHVRNLGWAQTSRDGIAASRGELIAHFAGDGEACAADLLIMLAELDRGFDIVLGVRTRIDYSALRLAQHIGQRLLLRLFFGLTIPDSGGPRIAKAHIWKALPGSGDSATFLTERLVVARNSGVRIGYAPVAHRWRSSGRSAFSSPRNTYVALRDLLRLRLSPRARVRMTFTKNPDNVTTQ